MIRFFVFTLTLFLLLSPAAKAQEATTRERVPEELSGLWYLPDCYFAEMFLFFTDHYMMRSDRALAEIGVVSDSVSENGYIRINDHKEATILKLGEDGESLFQYLTGTEDPELSEILEDRSYASKFPYKRCDKPLEDFASLHPGGLALFFRLEDIRKACPPDTLIIDNPSCQQAVFDAFDEDKDGALDNKELADSYIKATWLVASNSCFFRRVFPGNTENDAPLFAKEVFNAMDNDKNAYITLEEIKSGWHGTGRADLIVTFLQEVGTLGGIFPFIPYTGEHLTCVACDPVGCVTGCEGSTN